MKRIYLFLIALLTITSSFAVIGPITGPGRFCLATTTTLSDTTAGGTWSSTSTRVSVDASTGVVTGITAGTAIVSYTAASETATTIVTVTATLSAITSAASYCEGANPVFYSNVSDGTWSSSNTTVGTVAGIATTALCNFSALSAGTTTVTYAISAGCQVTKTITINVAPGPITGLGSLCAGFTTTLANAVPGGTWVTGSSYVATISSSGLVTAIHSGTTVANYVLPDGCYSSMSINIPSATDGITGGGLVCNGYATPLQYVAPGGTWSSSNTAVANIDAATGVVTGASPGVTTISYTLATCSSPVTTVLTVSNTVPSISGASAICHGSGIYLSNGMSNGVWSSSNTAVATVGSANGIANAAGSSSGPVTISYSVGGCGTATKDITVEVLIPNPSGTLFICGSGTATVTNTVSGGSWSSSNTAVATVGAATGIVSSVSPGYSYITYTLPSGCNSSAVFYVYPAPAILVGCDNLGVGDSASFSHPQYSAWNSSNAAVASVDGFGRVYGISAGTAVISNYSPFVGCLEGYKVITVTPAALIHQMTGNNVICPGETLLLSDINPGGSWNTGSASIATITATGTVTGIAGGQTLITYTNAAGTASCTRLLYVNSAAAPLSGPTTMCAGDTITLSENASPYYSWGISNTVYNNPCSYGCAWGGSCPIPIDCGGFPPGSKYSSSDSAIALPVLYSASGRIRGMSAGTAIITYTEGATNCKVTSPVTVNATSVSPIGGTLMTCTGGSTTLTNATPGGTWSTDAGSSGIATLSGGTVTGITEGVITVSYIVSNSCGTYTATASVTINTLPAAGTISGTTTVCEGATTMLASSVSGGTWSTSNGNASVAAGTVTGISAGTTTISYTATNSCGASTAVADVTINPLPVPGTISGSATICEGAIGLLTTTGTGGIWTTDNGNATVAGGVITGVTAGDDTVRYSVTNGCGTVAAVFPLTITPLPVAGSISGPISVCVGATATLTASGTGGFWAASNSNASVLAGVVTGNIEGIDTLSYAVTNSCGTAAAIYMMTVNPLPDAGTISGTAILCEGSDVIFTSSGTGGTWSSASGSASVTGGTVTAMSAGPDVISYSVTNACGTETATYNITVNAMPGTGVITGPAEVCAGSTITLTGAAPGGSWSTSNTSASVISGTVAGISAGVDTIIYTVSNVCGTATTDYVVTVNPLPAAGTISGPSLVCIGTAVTLSSTSGTGVWSASNGTASVTGGVVSGITPGTDTIRYTATNSCGTDVATYVITVEAMPNAGILSGPSAVCEAAAIVLSSSFAGGTWSSGNTNASVAGGTVTGLVAGTSTISYTVGNACGTNTVTRIISVNPLPVTGTVTGPDHVCPGTSVTLISSVTGGFWNASNSNATVSLTGVVTGVTAGAVVISYSLINACGTASAIAIVIIDPSPNAGIISGSSALCVAATTALTSTVTGGTWTAANGNATITPAGLVHGASAGTDTFYYSVTNSCGTTAASKEMTINPLPYAGTISGTATACEGAGTTLTSTVPGGTWSASNGNATILAGEVTGVTAGTVVMTYSYTNACGTAIAIRTVTVSPMPSAGTITGTGVVCESVSTTLTDVATGGVWSAGSGSVSLSPVTGGCVVTGVSAGTATISYTVTNSCGVEGTTFEMTVDPLPPTGAITGPASVCSGNTITLDNTVTGGTWSVSNAHATIVTAGAGSILTAVSPGTVIVSYTATNSCGTAAATKTVTVNPLPNAGTIAGGASVCIGDTLVLLATSPGGSWSHDNGNATVAGGVVTGVHPGTVTISYTVTNSCGTAVTSVTVLVSACGPDVVAVTTAGHEPRVFPNPAAGELNISVQPGSYQSFVITNSTGAVITQSALDSSGNSTVSVKDLAPGIYYIKLVGTGKAIVRKFVKL